MARKKNNNGQVDALSIFDPVSGQALDLIKVALLEFGLESHLPELYDIFGEDDLLKFLDIFGGCTIKVPSRYEVRDVIRDVRIYLELSRIPRSAEGRQRVVNDLCTRYDLTGRSIYTIFGRMERSFAKYRVGGG